MNELKEYTEKLFEDVKHIDEKGNEYWLARQGIHLVYHFGFSDGEKSLLPEYLEYGYLAFDYNFTKPSIGDIENWFGTFMISDEYNVYRTNAHSQEQSVCGEKWPKEKFRNIIYFNKNVTVDNDPKDVPLYGNYYLQNNGTMYLPLNKIVGKYLTFGIRGTYSTYFTEKDNGRYTGTYRGLTDRICIDCNIYYI